MDVWKDSDAFDAFLDRERARYDALDAEAEGLTVEERRIGGFQRV